MYRWEVEFKDSFNNDYIYDYWKNSIFHAGECFKEVRKLFLEYDIDAIISQLSHRFSKEEITLNYKRVQKLEDSNNIINDLKNKSEKDPHDFLPDLSLKTFEKRISHCRQLTIEVTQSCNLRCKYCIFSGKYKSQRTHSESLKIISFDVARKSIDYFFSLLNSKKRTAKYDSAAIGFYGGEPLLGYELIKECVEYIKTKETDEKISFTITTNGAKLTDEMVDFFIENDFMVLISIDGPKEEHDKFRVFKNNKGTFDKVWKGIQMFKKNKKFFLDKVNFSTSYCSGHNLLAIERFFTENIKGNVMLTSRIREEGVLRENIEPDPHFKENYKKLFQKYYDSIVNDTPISQYCSGIFSTNLYSAINRDINSLDKRLRGELKIFGMSGNCFPGEKIFVDSDGIFFICERVNRHFSIGDYMNGIEFEKVKRIIDLYSEFTLTHCLSCEARRFCGCCISHHCADTGVEYNSNCINTRSGLRDVLSAYVNLYQSNKKVMLETIYDGSQ